MTIEVIEKEEKGETKFSITELLSFLFIMGEVIYTEFFTN